MTKGLLVILLLGFIANYFWKVNPGKISFTPAPRSSNLVRIINDHEFYKLKTKASTLKLYALQNGYSSSYCFLLDMSIYSGHKRFFIYDLKKDSVISSGLVAHGSCGSYFLETASFSNNISCGCSSDGKYKIGNNYNGRFGKAYKLFGLDSSNSNAYKRAIVLHAYKSITDNETFPEPIGNSLGCPMVSYNFFAQTSAIIERAKKPVLLWIFN